MQVVLGLGGILQFLYWSYDFVARPYKGSNFDGVRITFNGKTFWALAPEIYVK